MGTMRRILPILLEETERFINDPPPGRPTPAVLGKSWFFAQVRPEVFLHIAPSREGFLAAIKRALEWLFARVGPVVDLQFACGSERFIAACDQA